MPLHLTNNRDIHLAQEWIVQLHTWIARNGLTGYDPFDVKAHPYIRCSQSYSLARKATTLGCDLFPVLTRRGLGIPPSLNPKALALTAMGHLRLFQITDDACHLDNGLHTLQQLKEIALTDYAGPCWGYPFPVYGKGVDCPANTPVAVVCAIAGSAFLMAYEITQDEGYLDQACGIVAFFLEDLPRVAPSGDEWCFAYTPKDLRRVHNANLLAIEHIWRTATFVGRKEWIDETRPALLFTLKGQHANGAWPYGAWCPGEPFEGGLMTLIDHHHSGFVLRSLYAIYQVEPTGLLLELLHKGYSFYRTLIRQNGMPISAHAAYPVDIHACAEGVLCNSVLSECMPGAFNHAAAVLRWTHVHLRRWPDGAPWYRKYPFFTSRIVFPRWGVAWMYRALAEYLYMHSKSSSTHHKAALSSSVE